MFSKLKRLWLAWKNSELSFSVFISRAKDDDSECSLPSMVPYTKVKFPYVKLPYVFGYRKKIDNSELGIVTFKQFHVSYTNSN